MDEKEIEHRLTEVEKTSEHNAEKLKIITEKLEDLTDLVIAVRDLAIETKFMRESLNDAIQRISSLEKKDAEAWHKFKWLVIGGIVTVLIAYIAMSLGLKK